MFLDFLKKKLQDAVARPAGGKAETEPTLDYEERRKAAQALHDQGKTEAAVTILEELAGELAGLGNFPLAVAVRHQIHQWRPGAGQQDPVLEGQRMATQHSSGTHRLPSSPTNEATLTKLAQVSPFLEQLTGEEIAGLISSTGRVSYKRGETVVEEGATGEHLYIVTRGVLSAYTRGSAGRPVRVGTLAVGDFFGEVAVLTGKPRAATVVAESSAECLEISAARWRDLAESHPRLRQLLEESIGQRAELAAEAVLDDMRRRREGERPSG